MTKSPCINCDDLHADKNAPACTNCAARLEYDKSFGRPWDMRPPKTGPLKETKTMIDPVITRTEPENPNVEKRKPKEKYCKGCEKTKSIDEFTREKQRADGRARLCKVCKNKAQKKYRQHAGRADTKAGSAKKIKAIYIDPPLPQPLEDIPKPINENIKLRMIRQRAKALYHNCHAAACFNHSDADKINDDNDIEAVALRREAQVYHTVAGWLNALIENI